MIGKTLAHYEIVGELGRGGMGEVYRAIDTKLKREVAIKVLPEEFTQDRDRLARFEREAQILASLNHPNIATIHGIEDADGVKALVLELVEGPTLAERIAEGPILIEEVLAIARQIADALEAAHEAGVIHRDLKPPNVKLRDDGTVKVLDFGLAKALANDAAGANLSELPTVTAAGTRAGVILGTPAYMSPEQARGKPLDKRTDIWSFGCVLYEILTGRAAFLGETLSDTLASILERDPDWSALPPATPRNMKTLLRRCLQKQTTRRLRDIGDARMELEETFDDVAEATTKETSRGSMLPWGVSAVLAVALAVLSVVTPIESPTRVVRTAIPLPPDQQVTGQIGLPLAMAPDGRRLAYTTNEAGTTRLYLRELDEPDVRAVPETDGARYPFFSSDSEWLGYWAAGRLYRVLATGGPPLPIGEAPDLEFGAAWGPDGTIIFANASELFRIPATGGVAAPLGTDHDTAGVRWPQFLPDGGLLAVRDGSIVRLELKTLTFETLLDPTVLRTIKQVRCLPSGHLAYGSAGDIITVSFDLDTLKERSWICTGRSERRVVPCRSPRWSSSKGRTSCC